MSRRTKAAAGQRGRPGSLQHHVGGGQQCGQPIGDRGRNRLNSPAFRRSSSRRSAGSPPRVPSGRAGLSTLTTTAPARASSCPHSGPAHIEVRSATSNPASGRGDVRLAAPVHPGCGRGRFAESRRGQSEQPRALAPPSRRCASRPTGECPATGSAADAVDLEQGRHGGDVVVARQRQRAPPVGGRHQVGGAARGHPAARCQPQQRGAARQQFSGVGAERVGDRGGAPQHATGNA